MSCLEAAFELTLDVLFLRNPRLAWIVVLTIIVLAVAVVWWFG